MIGSLNKKWYLLVSVVEKDYVCEGDSICITEAFDCGLVFLAVVCEYGSTGVANVPLDFFGRHLASWIGGGFDLRLN